MTRTQRRLRLVGLPVALVVAGAGLSFAPVNAATPPGPCDMKVTLNRTSVDTYANGVERATYTAKVTYGSHSQTATVQRMVMPPTVKPRVVTKKLGELGQLRSQLDSKRGNHGIAAVNGDFFYGYHIEGRTVYLPRSASIAHGRAVRLYRDRMRVVGIDVNGNNFIGEVGLTGTVTHGSTVFTLDGLNWQVVGDAGVVVFTPTWSASSSAPRPRGAVEWLVKNGKLVKVLTGSQTGKPVPAKAKIVAFGPSKAAAAKHAKVGSVVAISIKQAISPNVPLREAIGRGNQLVDNGALKLPCVGMNNEARPRTTVGWTVGGRWMTMTVPGSGYDRNGYRIGGFGLSQEAKVAIALGFDNAAELDGGGSTTAYVRKADNSWDRVDDSDQIYQRPVPNALSFVQPKK